MNHYLPNGTLGIAVAGLLAAFMAGMAANVSSFNTVFTYDIWQTYIKKNKPDHYYLNVGRIVTVVGIIVGIGTAFIASQFSNIMNYIQTLFSFFNAPVFATFIIGMFWKRTTPWAGFFGLVSGFVAAVSFQYLIGPKIAYFYAGQTFEGEINAQMLNFYGAIVAFVVDAVVTVVVTLFTTSKPVGELEVWSGACPIRTPEIRTKATSASGTSRPSSSASPPWASSSSCRSSSSEGGKAHVMPRTDLRRARAEGRPGVGGLQAVRPADPDRRPVHLLRRRLTIYGFFTTPEDLAKAAGININLWLGLGMLVLGGFFTAWWRLSPLRRDQPPDATGTGL